MKSKRIVVAMSGGVDSSVAALLLKEQGYDVVGVFLRTGVAETQREDQRHRGCCSALDARDARGVADRLGVPCYSLDFSDDFRQVMSYFADEYVQGRTPNPCVVCNSEIKFGKLWQLAQSLDAECLRRALCPYRPIGKPCPPCSGQWISRRIKLTSSLASMVGYYQD